MFTFRAQPTQCSKHHNQTVIDAGCDNGQLTLPTAGLFVYLAAMCQSYTVVSIQWGNFFFI